METQDLLITMALTAVGTLVVLPLVAYHRALARGLRAVASSPMTVLQVGLSRKLHAFSEGLRQLKAWQVIVAAFAMAMLFSALNHDAVREGVPGLLAVAGLAILLVMGWAREFLFLMSLRDEDLPGRFDKPIWVFFLVALPPAGMLLFRTHRLAHWPEPKPKPAADAARELA